MDNDHVTVINCGCSILYLVASIFIGAWSVNYLLAFFGLHVIPWIGAAAIGLFTSTITIPVAIVIVLLKAFGAF